MATANKRFTNLSSRVWCLNSVWNLNQIKIARKRLLCIVTSASRQEEGLPVKLFKNEIVCHDSLFLQETVLRILEEQRWLTLMQSKSNTAWMTSNQIFTLGPWKWSWIKLDPWLKLCLCFCASQGQLSLAPLCRCSGLLHHHAALYGSPRNKTGVQRRREGLSPSHTKYQAWPFLLKSVYCNT